MFQLLLLVISFIYGIIFGFFSVFFEKRKCLKILYFIFMTIVYVIIFYFINNGLIHFYNKLMLIFGYCIYYFFIYVKLNVKFRKIYRKKKDMWYPYTKELINMKKKKTNKGAVRRMSLYFIIFLCVLIYSGYVTFISWGKIIDKYQEKRSLEEKYASLIEEEKVLEKEVNKLQDPEYIAKYAREKYLYSADGEYIIKIVEE